jgi:hypothetical protein
MAHGSSPVWERESKARPRASPGPVGRLPSKSVHQPADAPLNKESSIASTELAIAKVPRPGVMMGYEVRRT